MNNATKQFTTMSGYELKGHYTSADLADFNEAEKLGAPGSYPYTRGIRENMYRDALWTMGQYAGFATAEEANQRYRYLIEQGGSGFSIALDLPTQMGLDSDDPMSDGEVGKVGVAIDSLLDIEALFDGIPFEKVRQIRTTANADGIIMLGFLVAFCRKNGIDPNNISFFIQNDCLKEYFCRGAYAFPPKAGVKLSADVIEYAGSKLPNWTPVAVSGYHIREAGATAAQEIAFTLANMCGYFDDAQRRGVDINVCARNIYFFLGAQTDVVEEIAKFRAARRAFAKIMKNRYGCTDPETQRLKIFCYTCGSALTAEQPLNNVVRVSLETMAAVAGGVQTIATSSYDEAMSLPTPQAVTVALRTQQIMAHESGLANTVDPFAGSYLVESLTDRIEAEIFSIIEEIDRKGGAVKCIEEGYFQKILSDNSYQRQKAIDDGEIKIVGTNCYRDEHEPEIPVFKLSMDAQQKQTAKLERLRRTRDNIRVEHALEAIRKAAANGENLGDCMIEAASAYATLGEICAVLQSVYGKYNPMKVY